MLLKILILYASSHYPHHVRIEVVTRHYERMESVGACQAEVEQTLTNLGFELAVDDATADYKFTCTEVARI